MIIPLLVSWITVAIAAESGSSCCVEKEVGTIIHVDLKTDVIKSLVVSLVMLRQHLVFVFRKSGPSDFLHRSIKKKYC